MRKIKGIKMYTRCYSELNKHCSGNENWKTRWSLATLEEGAVKICISYFERFYHGAWQDVISLKLPVFIYLFICSFVLAEI